MHQNTDEFKETNQKFKQSISLHEENHDKSHSRQFSSPSSSAAAAATSTDHYQFSFKQFLINSILVSLPHVAIFLIFLFYVLIGAAIFKEIESDNSLGNQVSTPINPNKVSVNVQDTKILAEFDAYQTNLNNLNNEYLIKLKNYDQIQDQSFNKFLERFDTIINAKEEAFSSSSSENRLSSKNETESLKFISSFYNKQKKKLNVTDLFKAIAQNLIDFKKDLKENFSNDIRTLFIEYNKQQTEFKSDYNNFVTNHVANTDKKFAELKRILKEFNADVKSDTNEKRNNLKNGKWDISTSIYFLGSLLTTIGYGDVSPYTTMGKLFTMFYLIFGIPLTMILLTDLGSIFTRSCKFMYAFLIIVYNEGYYGRLVKTLKTKKKSLFQNSNANAKFSKPHQLKRTDSFEMSDDNKDDNEEEANSQTSLFLSLCQIASDCYKQNDDVFDLSLGFLFGLLFTYLSLGAIVNSRVADWSFFNGYYFSLITLTKIGLGDLIIKDTKFVLISSLYTLFGIAFFELTFQSLREKIKLLLISNGQNIVVEIVKFANQFGYEWNIDNVYYNLGVKSSPNTNDLQNKETKSLKKNETPIIPVLPHTKRNQTNDNNKLKNQSYEIKKIDKQTQITTLLYTKFRIERNPVLSEKPISVASVKPNAAHLKESIDDVSKKSDSVDIVLAEEKTLASTVISKLEPIKEKQPQTKTEDAESEANTTAVITLKKNRLTKETEEKTCSNIVDKIEPIKEDVKEKDLQVIESTTNSNGDTASTITLRRNRFSTNTTTTPLASSYQSKTATSRFK